MTLSKDKIMNFIKDYKIPCIHIDEWCEFVELLEAKMNVGDLDE